MNGGVEPGENPRSRDFELKAFELVVAHYENDLRLYWTRANFFLLVDSGLLALVVQALAKSGSRISTAERVTVCAAGLALSVVWLLVSYATLHWIDVWRRKVVELDAKLDPVRAFSIEFDDAAHGRSIFLRLRPSQLSQLMPLIFSLAWIALGIATYTDHPTKGSKASSGSATVAHAPSPRGRP